MGEPTHPPQRPNAASPAAAGSAAPSMAWILVASLVRPHGRRGELVADILTDFPERFHERTRLFLISPRPAGTLPREVALENFWFQRNRIVLKFQGIDSINDAEVLRGFGVAIPAAERAPLEPGSVYVSDLIGCLVVDLNRGRAAIGEILDVDRNSSSTELLVVRRAGRRGADAEALIPFVKQFLVQIDLEQRVVEMRLPEGLLEINAPMTEEEKQQLQQNRVEEVGDAGEDPGA